MTPKIDKKSLLFVLVAGNLSTEAWNRLTGRNDYPFEGHLGGNVWNQVTSVLETEGHSVFAPTLMDEATHTLSDQIEVVTQLIQQHNLNTLLLNKDFIS